MRKVILFGVSGAVGAFIAAILGEILYAKFSPPPPPPPPPAHILFVLDATASMTPYKDGIIQGIDTFVSAFHEKKIDVKVGLIAFYDRHYSPSSLDPNQTGDDEPVMLNFGSGPFTSDMAEFRSQLSTVKIVGNTDTPESSMDALAQAARMPVPKGAPYAVVLITDADPKIPDKEIQTTGECADILAKSNIQMLNLVIHDDNVKDYALFHDAVHGGQRSSRYISLDEVAKGNQKFESLLPDIGTNIAASIQNFAGSGQIAKSDLPKLILLAGLVSALVAAGIALWLIGAQNHYLGKPVMSLVDLGKGLLGGGLAGAIAGVAAQMFFASAGSEGILIAIQRLIAWMLMGGLLGLGIAFFVPNLKAWRGVLGGALGGLLGAFAFIVLSSAHLGDTVSRLVGFTVLGLCIGLMIAIVESLLREAWLTIHYGPRETRTVGLGSNAVLIGSDRERCTVYALEAPPIALSYRLEGGKVLCEDVASGRSAVPVSPGDRRKTGRLEIEVMGGAKTTASLSDAASSPPLPPTPAPTPTSTPPPTARGPWTPTLVVNGRRIPLSAGTNLSASDLGGASAGSAPLAAVIDNPKQPGALGLNNRSTAAWTVHSAGDRTLVEPGKTIRLKAGQRIEFGSSTADVA